MDFPNYGTMSNPPSVKKGEVQIETEEVSLDYAKRNSVFLAEEKLSSALKSRHISMISLVGVFGTGLFLSSGGTLATAGPVGMLLGFVFVGIVVLFNQICVCEVSCLMPVTSGPTKHTIHFTDEALGFAYGWICVYGSVVPGELSATAVIVSYWTDLNPGIFIAIFGIFVTVINCWNVKWYGEVEFFFGALKILLIVGLIITGVIIDLGGVPGQERLGFHYWKEGAFNAKYTTGSLGQFAAFWKAISSIVYSFGGVQSISFLAGETEYPRRAIHRSAKRVFTRVFTLYFLAVFVLTLIVSSHDEVIASPTGTASGSPFVVAMKRAGIQGLPHIINGVVLSSALSAASLSALHSSRNLFALASKGQAPKIFLKTNRNGLPWVAVAFGCAFIPLAFMSINSGSAEVFSWFQGVTSSNLLIGWFLIALNHIQLSRAMKAQGYTRDQLPYKFPLAIFGSYFSLFFSGLFLLTGGFPNFIKGNFYFPSFFSSYFSIVILVVLYAFWKIWKRTKWLSPHEINLESLFQDVIDSPEPPYPKRKGWEWIKLLWD